MNNKIKLQPLVRQPINNNLPKIANITIPIESHLHKLACKLPNNTPNRNDYTYKLVNSNGSLCYPIKYFSQKYSTLQLTKLHPIFNRNQQTLIKHDRFHNLNYKKSELFLINNLQYSNIQIH